MPAVPTDRSISQFLLESNPDDAHPERVILADFEDPEGSKLTYAALRHAASRRAATLRGDFGLRERDVVCIYAQNSVEWIKMAHAVLWAGGCFWCA